MNALTKQRQVQKARKSWIFPMKDEITIYYVTKR
jgi:hypothetical protein